MKIIYNNIIPFGRYLAINLFGILFVRKDKKHLLDDTVINHEQIHTAQMKELLYIGFYIIYLLEWLYKAIIKFPFNWHLAYRDISFEKEAFMFEPYEDYLEYRTHYSQWR